METYVELASKALWLIFVLSMPPLLASLIVGLLISFLQALTQVQEQTLTFVPKIIATIITLIIFAGWTLTELKSFAFEVFQVMNKVGHGI